MSDKENRIAKGFSLISEEILLLRQTNENLRMQIEKLKKNIKNLEKCKNCEHCKQSKCWIIAEP